MNEEEKKRWIIYASGCPNMMNHDIQYSVYLHLTHDAAVNWTRKVVCNAVATNYYLYIKQRARLYKIYYLLCLSY